MRSFRFGAHPDSNSTKVIALLAVLRCLGPLSYVPLDSRQELRAESLPQQRPEYTLSWLILAVWAQGILCPIESKQHLVPEELHY